MAIVSGIDGCVGGWLCLNEDVTTGRVDARILTRIHELLLLNPRPDIVAVDIPIGLTDTGPRHCDLEARKRLGPRRSSVFPAPVRSTLVATSYSHACQLGKETDGRKLSQQTYAILRKVREVDEFLRDDSKRQNWIREVHPEVSFWAWNGDRPMAHPKRRKKGEPPLGKTEREALVIPRYGTWYSAAQSALPHSEYAYDDLLDAFAALWSAERIRSGKSTVLPDKPVLDSYGLRMEIVA
jgi:predicted RNase H-like nuclease